ncbi:MAG: methyltransferase domain-containing protein [Gemmatimonadaceae bacterium]|nr:methyltransferase domain-containing protein [Gemmatimonadaceae bacterium]
MIVRLPGFAHFARTLILAVGIALVAGCESTQGTPEPRAQVDSLWTSYARGLPADSFPAPSRRFSRIVAPRWTDEGTRDAASEAETVIANLPLLPGMSVADIGAGDGYYVTRMSRRVGPTGHVYGQDIIPEYLNLLADRVREAGLTNVTVVRGEAADPRLPRDSIDAAIMIHMYHEITEPYAQLWNLAQVLKPGAHLAILDTTFPTDQHGTPPWLLECELGVVGFEKVRSMSTGPDEYLTVFRTAPRDSVPTPAMIRERVAAGACLQR